MHDQSVSRVAIILLPRVCNSTVTVFQTQEYEGLWGVEVKLYACLTSVGKKRKYELNWKLTWPYSLSAGPFSCSKGRKMILLHLKWYLWCSDRSDSDSSHCNFDRWREMLRPPTLRPLMLVIPYFLIQQFAGMASIRPFMVHVFRQLGLDDAAEWTTVIGQFSHTRNLIFNCANIHAPARGIRSSLFQPNSNDYNLYL